MKRNSISTIKNCLAGTSMIVYTKDGIREVKSTNGEKLTWEDVVSIFYNLGLANKDTHFEAVPIDDSLVGLSGDNKRIAVAHIDVVME